MTAPRTLRTFFVLLVLALSAVATLLVASPASAATPCGKKVLADWFDNGRIDRLYPLNCYEEAIDAIPADIGPYSDAEEIITRALQAALRGDLDAGGDDPTPNGDGSSQNGGGDDGGDDGEGGSGLGEGSEVAPNVDTSGPSSVPIPLLVLGGMSAALLAAGGLGYLSRRRATAQTDDPGNHDPLT